MKLTFWRICTGLVTLLAMRPGALGADGLKIGDLDPSFDAGLQPIPANPFSIVARPGSGFFLCRGFDFYESQSCRGLAACLPDGHPDPAFSREINDFGYVLKILPYPGNKWLVLVDKDLLPVGLNQHLVMLDAIGNVDYGFSLSPDIWVEDFAITPGGKIYITYAAESPVWREYYDLQRLETDGTPDSNFQFGGGVQHAPVLAMNWQNLPSEEFVGLVRITNDEGSAQSENPTLLRLNDDGTLDDTFAQTEIRDSLQLNFLANGRPVVIGYNSMSIAATGITNSIFVFRTDGTVDSTFDTSVGTNLIVNWMQPLASGGLACGGSPYIGQPNAVPSVVMLDGNGALLEGFTADLGPGASSHAGAVLSDDSVVTLIHRTDAEPEVLRLDSTGTTDDSFSAQLSRRPNMFHLQAAPNGKWILNGELRFPDGSSGALARLNCDGSLDAFLYGDLDFPFIDMSVQEDGSVLFFAERDTPRFFGRILPEGGVDPDYLESFGSGLRLVQRGHRIAKRNDGKVFVAIGSGGIYAPELPLGMIYTPVVLLNQDGSADKSFAPTNIFGAAESVSILLQPDGRILLSGEFRSPNGEVLPSLLRLLTDGNLDESFSLPSGFDVARVLVALQNDEKILLAHKIGFANGNGLPDPAPNAPLIRINADGSYDTSFSTPFGQLSWITSVTEQTDHRLLICGSLIDRQDKFIGGIVRLEMDGQIDTTFSPVTVGLPSTTEAVVQGDGRVIIAGSYGEPFQTDHLGIARFESIEQPRLDLQSDEVGTRTLILSGNTNRVYEIESAPDLSGWRHFATWTNDSGVVTMPFEDATDQMQIFRARISENP